MAQKVQPIFAEIALTQTVTQMRISADRTGKDSAGELRAKLRSEKNFLRKLRCRAVRTALHLQSVKEVSPMCEFFGIMGK